MQTYRYLRCDVFTDRPYTGNGLVVFSNAVGLHPPQMQAIAREMNLSETVFVTPPKQGGTARIRIFTPDRELPFAGHPTLGAAFVIGDVVHLPVIVLETEKGLVPVTLSREGARVTFGWMHQPLPAVVAFEEEDALLAALGGVKARVPVRKYDNGPTHVVVVVDDAQTVATVRPDAAKLAAMAVDTFVVCAMTGAGAVKSRVFFMANGSLLEDPATGSAAGATVVHLAESGLWQGDGDSVLVIAQGEEMGRPSELQCRIGRADGVIARVEVGGSAVVIGRGELKV